MPIGGGRRICAHIEWPYSAARRCLPLVRQRAVAARTTTAAAVPAAAAPRRRRRRRATPTPYILGTTDKVVSLDPAGAYDLGSQQLIGNMYQNLLAVPAGGNKPEPDAAESCDFIGSEDVRLQAQAGPEVLERRPADVRGRQVLARPSAQDRGPERSVLAAGVAEVGRGDRSDDRDDEAQEGRRHVALHPHPQRRGDRPGRDLPGRHEAARRQGRSAPARTSSTSTRRTSRPCSRPTRTTPAPNKAQTPNFIVQYFEQAVCAEAGDRAG